MKEERVHLVAEGEEEEGGEGEEEEEVAEGMHM